MNNKKAQLNYDKPEISHCKCEVFSRSMGYVRPISNFNIGKRAEFEERNTFKEANAITTGYRHQELMKKAA